MPVAAANPSWWTLVDDAQLADHPLIVAEHLIREAGDVSNNRRAFWGTSGVYANDAPGSGSNADPTTADAPDETNNRFCVFDRRTEAAYRPGSVSTADLYLWGDLDEDNGRTVDIVAVGYDFTGINFNIDLRVRLMEYRSASTGSNLASRTIAASDPRVGLVFIALPSRYTGVGGWRLHLDAGGTMSSNLPGITEVVLGRRCQLGVMPERPYDLDGYEADAFQYLARSGFVSTVTKHRERWQQEVTFDLQEVSNRWGWSDVELVQQLALDTRDFCEPYAVFPVPGTTPTRGHWVQSEPGFRLPQSGRRRREWVVTWREVAPFYRVRLLG